MSNISSTQLIINKKIINQPITTLPIGASRESMLFFKEMVDLYSLNVTNFSAEDAFDRSQVDLQSVESLLFDRRVEFKVLISKIAMHLENGVRSRLFSQIDSLLDAKEWDEQDIPPGRESLKTFLRLLLSLRPERLPGMSATGLGTIVASWYSEGDQLIIDCLPGDRLGGRPRSLLRMGEIGQQAKLRSRGSPR